MKTERINTPLYTIFMYKELIDPLIHPKYLTRFGEEEFSRNHVRAVASDHVGYIGYSLPSLKKFHWLF
jgi:hypothetical protein